MEVQPHTKLHEPKGEPREKTCWKCGKTFVTAGGVCPDDGARLIDVVIGEGHDPFVGHTVAERYAVHAKLGEGGMGNVYAAREVDTGRDVALKILKDDFLRDEGIRRRFMHEARILSELTHPNAVGLDDFGQLPSGGFFMVMELLAGESLAERLTYSFLTYRDIFHYIPVICDVLRDAHALGVIHRDLKPENIYISVDADGREVPKLIDFGVAKDLGRKTVTRAGTLWGTPAYMSPEQARGDTIGAQADVYAIGIILYELICGHLPFNATTQMGYAVRHMHAPARPMRSVPGLTSPPEALDDFVLSMLAKEPSARPASMDEVVQALRDFSYQLEDAGLLDTTPAQEVDPVALKGWFAEGDDFPGASSEMPAVGPSTPTAHPATPSAAPTLESSRDDLVPTREVAAGGLELPALEPTTHQGTTTRNALVAVGAGVAICLVVALYLVLVRAPEEPIVLEDTTAAAPSVAPAEPTPAAPDEPAAPDTVPAADVAVDTPDASSELELLREREVAAVGAAAIQAAGVIMLAQELCEPDDAPSKTSPPKRKKPGRRRPGRSSKDDTKKSALTDAVKGTF